MNSSNIHGTLLLRALLLSDSDWAQCAAKGRAYCIQPIWVAQSKRQALTLCTFDLACKHFHNLSHNLDCTRLACEWPCAAKRVSERRAQKHAWRAKGSPIKDVLKQISTFLTPPPPPRSTFAPRIDSQYQMLYGVLSIFV